MHVRCRPVPCCLLLCMPCTCRHELTLNAGRGESAHRPRCTGNTCPTQRCHQHASSGWRGDFRGHRIWQRGAHRRGDRRHGAGAAICAGAQMCRWTRLCFIWCCLCLTAQSCCFSGMVWVTYRPGSQVTIPCPWPACAHTTVPLQEVTADVQASVATTKQLLHELAARQGQPTSVGASASSVKTH